MELAKQPALVCPTCSATCVTMTQNTLRCNQCGLQASMTDLKQSANGLKCSYPQEWVKQNDRVISNQTGTERSTKRGATSSS